MSKGEHGTGVCLIAGRREDVSLAERRYIISLKYGQHWFRMRAMQTDSVPD
jgi:hypothetical protein